MTAARSIVRRPQKATLRILAAGALTALLSACAAQAGRIDGPGYTGGYVGVSGGLGSASPAAPR